MTLLFYGLGVQFRVLGVLIAREVKRRFGGDFGGLLTEFISVGFVVVFMVTLRAITGAAIHRGMPIVPFVASGIITVFVARTSFSMTVAAPMAFRSLREVPRVSILDLDIARFIVNLLIYTVIAIAMFSIMVASGYSDPVEDPLGIAITMFIAALFGFFFGFIFRMIMPRGPFMRIAMSLINRAALWLSGAYFVVPELPYKWREYALYNPLIHLTEIVRSDYFVVYASDYVDKAYVGTCLAVLIVFGLIAERGSREKWATL